MVKNFMGQRVVKSPRRPASPVVRTCMSKKIICFSPEDSMEMVIHTLIRKRISGAPVVNERGELVGVISEGDCLKQIVRGKYTNLPSRSGLVRDHMSREVETLSPDTPLLEAAQAFLKMKLRRFPIVENGRLIGLLSQSDIMGSVYGLKSQTWSE